MSENLTNNSGAERGLLEDPISGFDSESDIDLDEDTYSSSSGDDEYQDVELEDETEDQLMYEPLAHVPVWATDLGLDANSTPRPSTPTPIVDLGQAGPSFVYEITQVPPSPSNSTRTLSAPGPQPQAVASPWVRVDAREPEPDLESVFTCRNPGPRDCPVRHEPIDYFKLFVSDGLINLLIRESNKYAKSMIDKMVRENTFKPQCRLASWTDVTLAEMKTFLAIVLGMGVCRRNNIEDYWSNDSYLLSSFHKQAMSLRRFQAINRALHLSSRVGPARGQPGYDPWVKVRPFLDAANNAFVKHFVPGQNLSLDESMIGMKNSSGFITYMPNKRHARYGIKKFELVDASSMYVVHMALYSGKDYLEESEGPFTQKVVMDLLTRGRCLDKGYHVFTDNYYTKIPLARALLDRNTLLTGTIDQISKGLPKELTSARLEVMEPVYYRQDEVLVVGFKEKPTRKPVFLLSTAYQAAQQTVLNARCRKVSKPVVINKYNKFMGGVNCKDHTLYHLTCTRTTKRYWKKIFYNLLDTCVQNAYVIYAKQCIGVPCSAMTRSRFILSIIHSLVEPVQTPPTQNSFAEAVGSGHKLEHIPKTPGKRHQSQKMCAVCCKRARHWCPGCNSGVHEKCYSQLRHFYRPKYARKTPAEEDSD